MNTADPNSVLVIDPDPATRALILALLRREGYVAVAAAGPDEALRVHRDRRHAAVILDPRVDDGEALLNALQTADDDATPSSNLIVVTTREQSPATYHRHPGVHAVLFKPFVLNDLAEAVASCCDEPS